MNDSKDLQLGGSLIRLSIRSQGPVPSFKNAKRIAGLKKHGNQWIGQPKLITRPDVKQWMRQAISSFVSQWYSGLATDAPGTTPACSKQSVTASWPLDDGWEDMEIGSIKTILVPKGEEGADIIIEQL